MDLTDYLAHLAALSKAATPGPWRSTWRDEGVNTDDTNQIAIQTLSPSDDSWLAKQVVGLIGYDGLNVACREPDAALIAESRNAIEALVEVAMAAEIAMTDADPSKECNAPLFEAMARLAAIAEKASGG